MAYWCRVGEVRIDLLGMQFDPPVFDIFRNQILVEKCRTTLLYNVQRLTPPAEIRGAELVARFGIDEFRYRQSSSTIGTSTFTVILTDEQGKTWSVTHTEQDMLAVQ